MLENTVPDYKALMNFIFWDDRNLTPEEIVEEALNYQSTDYYSTTK